MTQAPVAALVVALTLAAVLLTSGLAKLRDHRATRDAFTALRVPPVVPADLAAPALPWIELALAVLLLVAPATGLVAVATLVLLLMLAYTALIARALAFDEPVTCSCFGSIGRHDVDRTTLARNVLLTALAAVVLWFAADGGSVPSALGSLDGGGWAALAATLAAAAVTVLVLGGPATSSPTTPAEEDLLDYERRATPYGALILHDGTSTSLVQLSASQARLLVVLNPGCGPCVRTAERLDDWAARLAPAVGVVAIYPDEASARAAGEHVPDLSAWEPELNVRRVFSVGAPAAVLLGADGYLAGGPVAGEDDVAAFVEDVFGVLTEQPSPAE
jgi:uncharacterized membrane protein YphA (DoxX/SURF4 family)/thiol-disulfide isomerase/thioredoxin